MVFQKITALDFLLEADYVREVEDTSRAMKCVWSCCSCKMKPKIWRTAKSISSDIFSLCCLWSCLRIL
jgi:hypothetical protein